MGGVRRTTEDLLAVRRPYIQNLIEKVDQQSYGFSIKGGLTPEEQKLRNKALIAILYLLGRRISEVVGRTFHYKDGRKDVWEGIKKSDFRMGRIEDEKILRIRLRVLKRGRQKTSLKVVMGFFDIRLSDPLSRHITNWLEQLPPNYEGRVFAISRQRAWQVITKIDPKIWNHWFRHQRFTHLSDTMDPFELKEFAKFAKLDTALHYVHKSPTKILAKVKEADELWK